MNLKEKQLASGEQEIVLRTLAESVAAPNCKFLEVGSWLGDSTVILAKVAKKHGGHLFCVDWWKGNVGTDLVDIASKADVFSVFWSRICMEGLEDAVVPIRSRSDLAAKIIRENSFDLVFLDADHRYVDVLNDIKQYAPAVDRKHGILCGHDCEGRISDYEESFLKEGAAVDYYETVHCGVVLAVGEMFPNCSINYGIWSVLFSSEQNAWVPTNVRLKEIQNERQTMPPPLGYSKEYFLMRYGKSVYALPRMDNPPDIKNEKDLTKSMTAVADSWQELEKKIKEPVILWLELYKDYNIFQSEQIFYALLMSVDVTVLPQGDQIILKKHQDSHSLFTAKALNELKYLVDQCDASVEKPVPSPIPVLVEEGYEGHNIVKLGTRYWALLQSLGPVDLSEPGINVFLERCVDQGKCFSGNSLFEVKYLISKSKNNSLQADVITREQNIGALKQDISHRDESIAKLSAEIQAHSKKREVLQADAITREQNIGALKQDISHRDESIAKLSAEIQAHSKKIEALQADVIMRERDIESLKTELALIKHKWWFRLFGKKL